LVQRFLRRRFKCDNLTYGKYVKQTSSQEPLDGLEPYMAEMFLARSLSSVVTFCSDHPLFKMTAVFA
jgi:hypothetical protein